MTDRALCLVRRALCAGMVVFGFESALAAVSSTSYVQRGLVCHFDALDNAGRGQHSSSATTWVDLTGNGNDATVHFDDGKGNQLKGYWSSRALCSTDKTTGVYADFTPAEALRNLLNSDGPWTIEIVDTMDNDRQTTSGCIEFGKVNSFGKTHAGTDFRGFFYIKGKGSGYFDVNVFTAWHAIPRTVTYVHDGTNLKRYRNGLVNTITQGGVKSQPAPKDGTKPLGETDKLQILYKLVGDMMAVRVYNRVLTENEMKYNVEIDRDRFFFRNADGLTTYETESFTALKVRVEVACPADTGTVSINGEQASTRVVKNVDFGASVTLTFTPSGDNAAHGWANLPVGTDTSGASVTFKAEQAIAAHVLTEPRTVHYVSKTSGDNKNDGSRLHPWASIQHAVANSAVKDFDEIRVQGGLYEENVRLMEDSTWEDSVKRSRVTIMGSYDANWARDLVGSRTIIRPAAHAGPAIQTYKSYSNVVDGVDLTGARIGFAFSDDLTTAKSDAYPYQFSTLLRHCFITNNYSHGVAAFGDMSAGGQPRQGVKCASCLIADNGGWGVGSNCSDNQTAQRLFTNCTIIRNALGGIRTQIAYGRGQAKCRNCILALNGVAQFRCESPEQYTNMRLVDTILWSASGSEIVSPSTTSVDSTVPILTRIIHRDPQLGASDAPTAVSHANKSGADVDTVAGAPATDDVYGRAWTKGAYDIGCFKTEHPRLSTYQSLDEVYVAADGDDSAAGDTEATALATVEEAMWRIRPHGVCHIGPGAYAGEIAGADKEGIVLKGAGPDQTVLVGPGTNLVNHAAFYIASSNVVLIGCAFSNATCGVINQNDEVCGTYPSATNCWFVGNRAGFRQYGYGYQMGYATWPQVFSRCKFAGNAYYGVKTNKRCIFESCLLARNGSSGYCQMSHDRDAQHRFLNCTIAGNGTYGIYKGSGNNASLRVVNSIIADNTNGVYPGGGYGSVSWEYTLFDNPVNEFYDGKDCTLSGMTASCITNKPVCFKGGDDVNRMYRLTVDSPACRAGNWKLYPWEKITPTHDLDGVALKRKLDMGCYLGPQPGLRVLVR